VTQVAHEQLFPEHFLALMTVAYWATFVLWANDVAQALNGGP
jgi:hypothetical protein